MTPTWVVQANMINQERQGNIMEVLKELQIPCIGVNVIPFSDDLTFLFDEPTHLDVIPYGSASLIRRAQSRGWRGLFFDEPAFSVSTWIAQRADDMLNRGSIVTQVRHMIPILRGFDPESFWHIRPDGDMKVFSGMVMRADEAVAWLEKGAAVMTDSTLFSQETPIAVSHAQTLLAEWRWFIVNGKVIDGAMYRVNGSLCRGHETNPEVIKEAQWLADGWLPHETCVMDTALPETFDEPLIVEFNCLNASGFYNNDVPKILKAVTESL